MPLQRERHFLRIHAASVITYVDQVDTTPCQSDIDSRRSGINRIFHEFLQGTRRSFNDFARSNAIDEMLWQAAY